MSHLVKTFPAFHETPRFITTFTRTRHLSLSWARSILSKPPVSHFLKIHFNFYSPSLHLGLTSGLFPSGTPPKSCNTYIHIHTYVVRTYIRRCIQKSQDNAHNTQVACSSRVSRQGVLRWCLVSECVEWRGWMWKRLIVRRVFMCVLHQPSAIFWYRRYAPLPFPIHVTFSARCILLDSITWIIFGEAQKPLTK